MIGIILYSLALLIIGLLYRTSGKINIERIRQFVLCFVLLFGFYGFRGLSVLNDTAHYYESFYDRLHSAELMQEPVFYFDIYERFEPGFMVVMRFIAKYVWTDPYAIILLSSLWVTIGILIFTGKFTNRIGLVVFFLWCGSIDNYYSAIRQGLSVMIFFLSYYYLEKRKLVLYYLFALLAFSCHRAGIILLLLPLIVYRDINKKLLLLLFVISFSVIYALQPILILLEQADSDYLDPSRERETFPIAHLILVLVNLFTVVCSYMQAKKYHIPPPNNVYIWMLILNIIIGVISLPLGILGRYGMYFSLFTIFYLVYVYDFMAISPNRSERVKARTMLTLFILLNGSIRLLQIALKNEWNHLLPYSFYDFFATSHQTDFGY